MGFFDDDDDDFFKHYNHDHTHFPNFHDSEVEFRNNTMEIIGGIIGFVAIAIFVICIVRCCCNRNRGQVLAPPPSVPPVPPGINNPYPQQQYVPAPHPAPVMYPSPNTTVHTASPAPYPQPAPYPAAAPYPPAAPYPAPAPYPSAMPQPAPYPAAVPNAPDAHALPPSYEQVMGPAGDTTPHAKQPPYNPYLSH